MIKFTVYNYPDYFLSVHVDGSAEVFKVKQLPGRDYDPITGDWIIPIRPGLADCIENIYGVTLAEPIRAIENGFMLLIEPPAAGSVNMQQITAGQAVELATLYTLFHKFKGDRAEYSRIYDPYKFGV